jgi:hypothetical protein
LQCQTVGRGSLTRRDGIYLHCIAKRQLSGRELRRYKLENELGSRGSAVFNMIYRFEDCASESDAAKIIRDPQDSAKRPKVVVGARGYREMRGEVFKEIGAPASGITAIGTSDAPAQRISQAGT